MADAPKMGRPSDYSDAVAAAICQRVAEGESVRSICRDKGLPDEATVYRWLAADRADFREQYARAKAAQMERFAEEIIEIADDGSNDWMERQLGEDQTVEVANHEHIQRSKLRVDARKWLMSKLAPKKYGERIQQELTGPDGGAIQVVTGVPRAETEPQS